MKGRQGRGRPNSVWMDEVRKALNDRRLTLEQAKMIGICRSNDDDDDSRFLAHTL